MRYTRDIHVTLIAKVGVQPRNIDTLCKKDSRFMTAQGFFLEKYQHYVLFKRAIASC